MELDTDNILTGNEYTDAHLKEISIKRLFYTLILGLLYVFVATFFMLKLYICCSIPLPAFLFSVLF